MKNLILVFTMAFLASSCGGDRGLIHSIGEELPGVGEVGEMFLFPHNGCVSYESKVNNALEFNDVCKMITFENGNGVDIKPEIMGEELTLENGYGFIEKVIDVDLSMGLIDEVGAISVGKHIIKFGVTKDLLTGLLSMDVELFKAEEVETVEVVTTVTEVEVVEVEVEVIVEVSSTTPDDNEEEDEDEDEDKPKKYNKGKKLGHLKHHNHGHELGHSHD